jgi:hypothetical protein
MRSMTPSTNESTTGNVGTTAKGRRSRMARSRVFSAKTFCA